MENRWIEIFRNHPDVVEIGGGADVSTVARPDRRGGEPQTPSSPTSGQEAAVSALALTDLEERWRQCLFAALDCPLDAVPFRETIYPGDKVAIYLGKAVPRPDVLAGGLVTLLQQHGVLLDDIAIVCESEASLGLANPLASAEGEQPVAVRQVIHRSEDTHEMAMVGVSRDDHPIYLNRWIAEADVVIPIVSLAADPHRTLANSLYPSLSSDETRERLRAQPNQAWEEALEAESLVCPFLMIGVIPLPGDLQGEVVAGLRDSLQGYAEQRLAATWTMPTQAFPLVVATVESATPANFWSQLKQGLQNAARLAEEQAPIVMVVDSTESVVPVSPPDPDAQDPPQKTKGVKSKDRRELITLVEELTNHRPVFLAGALGETETENLGFGHIASPEELTRLLNRTPRVAWLRSADQWRE